MCKRCGDDVWRRVTVPKSSARCERKRRVSNRIVAARRRDGVAASHFFDAVALLTAAYRILGMRSYAYQEASSFVVAANRRRAVQP